MFSETLSSLPDSGKLVKMSDVKGGIRRKGRKLTFKILILLVIDLVFIFSF